MLSASHQGVGKCYQHLTLPYYGLLPVIFDGLNNNLDWVALLLVCMKNKVKLIKTVGAKKVTSQFSCWDNVVYYLGIRKPRSQRYRISKMNSCHKCATARNPEEIKIN